MAVRGRLQSLLRKLLRGRETLSPKEGRGRMWGFRSTGCRSIRRGRAPSGRGRRFFSALSVAVLTVVALAATWLPLVPGVSAAGVAAASTDPGTPTSMCGPSPTMSLVADDGGAAGGSNYGSVWVPNQAS